MKSKTLLFILSIIYALLLLALVFIVEVQIRIDYQMDYECVTLGRIYASKIIVWYYVALLLVTLAGGYFLMKRAKIMALIPAILVAVLLKMIYTDVQKVFVSKKKFEVEEWKEYHPLAMAIYIKDEMDLEGLSRDAVIEMLGQPTTENNNEISYQTNDSVWLRLRISKGRVLYYTLGC